MNADKHGAAKPQPNCFARRFLCVLRDLAVNLFISIHRQDTKNAKKPAKQILSKRRWIYALVHDFINTVANRLTCNPDWDTDSHRFYGFSRIKTCFRDMEVWSTGSRGDRPVAPTNRWEAQPKGCTPNLKSM